MHIIARAFIIGMVLILAGCSPAGQPPAPAMPGGSPVPESEAPDLTGSEWVLAEIDGRPALAETAVTLSFPNPGELSGNAGCNYYFAEYERSGEAFSLTARGLETTSAEIQGCEAPESVPEQEKAYFAALEKTASIRLQGDRLVLLDAPGQHRLAFERRGPVAVDPALEGSAWTLISLKGEPLLPVTYISLEFDDGTAGGSAGCNSYGGTLNAASEGHLLISEIASTAMLCQRDDGVDVMQQEADYLSALMNAARYQIADGQLQVFDAGETLILVYEGQEGMPMDPSRLAGTNWLLLSIDGSPPVEGSQPSLAFIDGERVSGNAGCRDFTGAYQAQEDRIRFPQVGMVQIDCLKGEAFQAFEGQFTDVLSWANRYLLEADRLVLYTSRGEELVFGSLPGQGAETELEPNWWLVAFSEGGTESTPLAGSEISLQFEDGTVSEAGRVSGSAGCNTYSAAYTFDGSFFRFGPAGSTKMACLDPPGVMEQEQRFLAWLGEVIAYRVEGGWLYLETGDGRELVFEFARIQDLKVPITEPEKEGRVFIVASK